ncbi:hypothetical protein LCGC14_1005620 [marine sediment metagenome]|uniref:Uncharacterized protein n=1 Tax=marine sediment metagenome TaxID=412755 RepID=A0A0F9QK11_9ZZZZ|nr:hypothetical protein [Candidatus Aminicenantes bacterium]
MDKLIKETIDKLVDQRAHILQAICEDESIWQPQFIIQAVNEVRSITRMIRMLKGEKERL